MNVCIIGAGYVGLTTGVCLAEIGHQVICVDKDKDRIEKLKNNIIPFYEPNLDQLLRKNRDRITFTTDVDEGVKKSKVVFIAVGTPPKSNGEADLSQVEIASKEIAMVLDEYKVIVEKSTVPVGTGEWIKYIISSNISTAIDFDLVSNPEFLREGEAVRVFLQPDRIIIGAESEKAKEIMTHLYRPLNAPFVFTDIKSAEIIKQASNCFLAMKISYINAIANICEIVGADIVDVANGMGHDRRIGREFLNAGIGYGGSCFPKDVAAFIKTAETLGYDFELLKEVQRINQAQRKNLLKKVKRTLPAINGKSIGILGLSFKPNTDDIRDAPSIDIIEGLLKDGVRIKVYDPAAMGNMRRIFNDLIYCNDAYEAAEDAHAVLFLTEWDEFKSLDLLKLKQIMAEPIIIDGRNIFNPNHMHTMGFEYYCIGRPKYL